MSRHRVRTMRVLLHTRLALPRWRGARLQALLDAPVVAVDATMHARAQELVRDVQRLAAWVPGARCFVRAIASVRLLRAEGVPARLRLGVRRVDGVMQAHAWVELDQRAVGEDAVALRDFAPLEDVHPAQSWQR